MKSTKIILFSLYIAFDFMILYLEMELSFFTIIIMLILMSVSFAIHLFAHEGGHFIGGLISGYKLIYLQIGPINVMVDRSKKIVFSLQHTHGGQCIMLPPKTAVIRYKAYNLGGIYANIFIAVISLLLLLFDSFYVTLFFVQLLLIGIIKIVTNLLPNMNHDIPNDGYVMKLLRHNAAVQKDYLFYLSLYASLFWNENICPDEYLYVRKPAKNDAELLYYNGIQNLLKTLKASDKPK